MHFIEPKLMPLKYQDSLPVRLGVLQGCDGPGQFERSSSYKPSHMGIHMELSYYPPAVL